MDKILYFSNSAVDPMTNIRVLTAEAAEVGVEPKTMVVVPAVIFSRKGKRWCPFPIEKLVWILVTT